MVRISAIAALAILMSPGSGLGASIAIGQTPSVATPRVYQRAGANTDIFAALIARQAAVARQPRRTIDRRHAMVAAIRRNIAASGSTIDEAAVDRVLSVMDAIPRERFVPRAARDDAYIPFPVPIGHGQTISDAYIVAVMTIAAAIGPTDHVLDIGTGSGYQAAVLARIAARVSSIEIVEPLATEAAARLKRMRYRNVTVVAGDGFAGLPADAPYDAIVVAAGARAIPAALIDQLKPGGRLVMPIGPDTFAEQLLLVTRSAAGTLSRCSLGPAAFVPFTGAADRQDRQDRLQDVPLCFGAPVT